ncbi:MAG: hypothetical protein AAGI70_14210 [Pseudomonadota bacterium]
MKKILIATALIAATAATASAESAVTEKRERLNQIFAQVDEHEVNKAGAPNAVERVLGRLNLGIVSPVTAETGAKKDFRRFGAGNRGR